MLYKPCCGIGVGLDDWPIKRGPQSRSLVLCSGAFVGYACFIGRGNVPQRGLLGEAEDAQEFARGPLGNIPGAAKRRQERGKCGMRRKSGLSAGGTSRGCCQSLSLRGGAWANLKRDWSMLRQVREHLVLSVHCLRVGKWTRMNMHL